MSQTEQVKELESLYREFEAKFAALEQEQFRIVAEFLESVRLKKIEELRMSMSS